MKKIIITALLAIVTLATGAQPGAPDLSFNGSGFAVNSLEKSWSYAMTTSVSPDGKIISAGVQRDTTLNPSKLTLMVIRYNPDGSVDQSFGVGGMVGSDYYFEANASCFLEDGKILIAGTSRFGSAGNFRITLCRLNSDGSFDNGFGQGGVVQDTLSGQETAFASAVNVFPDGRILIAGGGYIGYGTPDQKPYYILAMHHADGTMDTTFGNAGVIMTEIPNATGVYILGMAIQSDGKILLGNTVKKSGKYCLAMVRYHPDGTLDPGFGTNGMATDSAGVKTGCYKLAIQPDGKILVPAWVNPDDLSHPRYSLFRYNSDGTRDSSFGDNGLIMEEGGSSYNIVLQPDGKILTCGNLMNDSTIKHAVVKRYLSSGEPDFSFGTNGIADLNIEPPSGLLGLALCPDGKIAAAGYCNEAVSPSPTWRNTLTLRLNSFAVGISESGPGQIVRISPNPFVDFITVETPGLNGSIIEVHSIQGQMIELLKMEGEKGTFNLGHLPAGSYLLKTITGGNRQSVPMIKIK
jgi:uncharacterized delta-60 repeat protein